MREPIKTSFYEPPEVRADTRNSGDRLDDRLIGESGYSRKTGDERLAAIVAADIVDLVGAVTRRIEQMTSSLLFTGSFEYLLDDRIDRDVVLRHGHISCPERVVGCHFRFGSDQGPVERSQCHHRQLGAPA